MTSQPSSSTCKRCGEESVCDDVLAGGVQGTPRVRKHRLGEHLMFSPFSPFSPASPTARRNSKISPASPPARRNSKMQISPGSIPAVTPARRNSKMQSSPGSFPAVTPAGRNSKMQSSPGSIPAVTPEFHTQMYPKRMPMVTPDHAARNFFTPPPAPRISWHSTELEEDVRSALSLRSLPLLSWALRNQGCSCGIDHSVHAAIQHQLPEALECLLESGTMKELIHVPCRGQTPLHKAVSMTHLEHDVGFAMSSMLLSRGANVDATDAEGEAPLHVVCRTGSWPAVQLLLQHGADVNLLTPQNFTPLHQLCRRMAYCEEHLAIFEALLAHGAAPALRDADGYRPCDHINMACASRDAKHIKLFMRNTLMEAEQQEIRNERWCARRSYIFLRKRPETGHLVCHLPNNLLKAVARFL